MKKKTIISIFIMLLIIGITGFFMKNKIANDSVENSQIEKDIVEENNDSSDVIEEDDGDDDLDKPKGSSDIDDKSDTDEANFKAKGYLLSIYNHDVDFNELLKKTGLEDKMPVYSQLENTYNSAAIIETNKKVGPLYLVDCSYDKNTDNYTINLKSKQLMTEFIQSRDVLILLHTVDSASPKKAILLKKGDKNYFYPLSTNELDNLSGMPLYELK